MMIESREAGLHGDYKRGGKKRSNKKEAKETRKEGVKGNHPGD